MSKIVQQTGTQSFIVKINLSTSKIRKHFGDDKHCPAKTLKLHACNVLTLSTTSTGQVYNKKKKVYICDVMTCIKKAGIIAH